MSESESVYLFVCIIGSPFKVPAKDVVDSSKVKISGPGVGSGVRAKIPQSFTVDCSKAGVAPLSVAVTGPKGKNAFGFIHLFYFALN